MPINGHELARMTDLTMIDQLATKADMEALIANAKKYDTWVAVGLKCYIPMLVEGLNGTNTMVITGCSSRQGSDELETKIAGAKRYIELGVGEMTLRDIASELEKPGRDPRDELPAPVLRTDVLSMEDLKPGMELTGTVRNVIDFGAFVDIGVHQDGLVHISRMADKFIRHPSEVVHVGDVVTVWVVDVDVKKQRIALSMVKGRT